MTFPPTTAATDYENWELNYSVCDSELRVTEMIRYDCSLSTEIFNRAARWNDQNSGEHIPEKGMRNFENFASFGGIFDTLRPSGRISFSAIRFEVWRKDKKYPALIRTEVETVCMEISWELKVTSDRMWQDDNFYPGTLPDYEEQYSTLLRPIPPSCFECALC